MQPYYLFLIHAIQSLHDTFVAEATRLAKIIVNEMNMPVAERSIKPKDFGGIAGGSKFAENGIFIKFATDIHGRLSFAIPFQL